MLNGLWFSQQRDWEKGWVRHLCQGAWDAHSSKQWALSPWFLSSFDHHVLTLRCWAWCPGFCSHVSVRLWPWMVYSEMEKVSLLQYDTWSWVKNASSVCREGRTGLLNTAIGEAIKLSLSKVSLLLPQQDACDQLIHVKCSTLSWHTFFSQHLTNLLRYIPWHIPWVCASHWSLAQFHTSLIHLWRNENYYTAEFPPFPLSW